MTDHNAQAAVLAALTAAFGAEVLPGDASPKYLQDWSGCAGGQPLAILRPRSTEELSRMLAICHAHGQAVVPQGGLTGLVGGAVPAGGEVVISLERMNRIERIDVESGTVIVEAGAILQTVQEACRDAGALLAVDLGARGSCQVGGNVSTNAGGNRVIRYGNTRDLVLGLEVVLADGSVLSMLNQMVKNNAGMDLKHLFIGSEGVLGIVTKVVFKLQPLPRGVSTTVVALQDYQRIQQAAPAEQTRLRAELAAEGVDVLNVLLGLLLSQGLPVEKMFDAIHAANLAKCVDGKVLRREDGKILKPAGWQAADKEGVIRQHGG